MEEHITLNDDTFPGHPILNLVDAGKISQYTILEQWGLDFKEELRRFNESIKND